MATPLLNPHDVAQIRKIKALENVKLNLKETRVIDGVSLAYIRSAITDQQDGKFEKTTLLARKLLTDEVYSSALNKRVNGLLRTEFILEPSDNNNDIATSIALLTEDIWFAGPEEIEIKAFLKSFLNTGVALAKLQWSKMDNGFWTPSFKNLSTEFLEWNSGEDHWIYRGFKSGDQIVTPGENNWVLMSEWNPGDVTGFVSQLSEIWFAKRISLHDNIEANGKHVDNIAIISKDNTPTSINSSQTDIDIFAQEIQLQKKNQVIYVPAGYKVEFTNAHTNYKPESFQHVYTEAGRAIRTAILGGNLASDISGQGSYAAASVHETAEKNFIASDAQILSTTLYKQLFKPLILINFGENYISKTPWARWNIAHADDLTAYTRMLMTAAAFLNNTPYKITNIPELMQHVNIDVGLKHVSKEENRKNNNSEEDSGEEETGR